jgi:hypothetical protein
MVILHDNDAKNESGEFYLEKKLEAMKQYLRRQKHAWGSTPEYTAFAFMSNCSVKVFQPIPGPEQSIRLQEVNSVEPEGFTDTIKLLYSGKNHYDLLLDDSQASQLVQNCVNGIKNILDFN